MRPYIYFDGEKWRVSSTVTRAARPVPQNAFVKAHDFVRYKNEQRAMAYFTNR